MKNNKGSSFEANSYKITLNRGQNCSVVSESGFGFRVQQFEYYHVKNLQMLSSFGYQVAVMKHDD